MKNFKLLVCVLSVIAILAVSVVPTFAFRIPENYTYSPQYDYMVYSGNTIAYGNISFGTGGSYAHSGIYATYQGQGYYVKACVTNVYSSGDPNTSGYSDYSSPSVSVTCDYDTSINGYLFGINGYHVLYDSNYVVRGNANTYIHLYD